MKKITETLMQNMLESIEAKKNFLQQQNQITVFQQAVQEVIK